MDFDPAAPLRAEIERVVSHRTGLLLVDGPTLSGRTTAIIRRAFALTQGAEDRSGNAARPGGIVLTAPTLRAAQTASRIVTMASGGTTVATLPLVGLAMEVLPAGHPYRDRAAATRREWRRTAANLLDSEYAETDRLESLWPTMHGPLGRASVRTSVITALAALHDEGVFGGPALPGALPDELPGKRNDGWWDTPHWQELHRFGVRLASHLTRGGLHTATDIFHAALASVLDGSAGPAVAGIQLLVDDAHRMTRLHRLFLARLVASRTTAPEATVITGDSNLAPWMSEFSDAGPVVIGLARPSPARPTCELRKLRHRALEADAVLSAVQELHAQGTPYGHIAVVTPSPTGPLHAALARAGARRGVSLHTDPLAAVADPVVSSFVALTRWTVTRQPADLISAQMIGLIGSSTDPRLPAAVPNSQRQLVEIAYTLWARVVARQALDASTSTADGCNTFLRGLQAIAASQRADSAAATTAELLELIDDSASALDSPRGGQSAPSTAPGAAGAPDMVSDRGAGDFSDLAPEAVSDDPAVDEFDAVEVLTPNALSGRSFPHIVMTSMVEGSWPRVASPVDGGFDVAELLQPGPGEPGAGQPGAGQPHRRDHLNVSLQRARFLDAVHRASRSVIAIAAPDPGVLVSRFVEGWPETRATVSGGSDAPAPETPETRSDVPCLPGERLRLSATRLDAFENCRLNFAFQYVAGVRGPGGVPASVGTMVHAALEAFLLPLAAVSTGRIVDVQSAPAISRERLLELLDLHWDRTAFPYRPQEADYRRRAETWLDKWHAEELPLLHGVIAVEHRFTVDVGPHTLTGSIDRISIDRNGDVEIVDYKTGSAPATSRRTDPDNLQLATYHLAAVTDPALRPFGEPKRLRLHYLPSGADVDQPVRPDHEAVTKARILSAADAILTEDFVPSVEADCEYCNFTSLCPIRVEGRTVESLRAEVASVGSPTPVTLGRRRAATPLHTPVSASVDHVSEPATEPGSEQFTEPGPEPATEPGSDPVTEEKSETVFQPLPEQVRAITHTGSPLLIVAGAGSGKTTVLAKRIVNLVIERGWRPDQILGLTFSNKAAGNLRSRVAQELGTGNDAVIMTYHGFGASILRRYGERIGVPPDAVLLDRARAWQLLLDSLDDVTIATRKTGNISSLVSDALSLASSCADHVVSIDAVRLECERMLAGVSLNKTVDNVVRQRLDLCAMAAAYENAKREVGCIDFGDQISLALKLVDGHADVAEALRTAHPVALLDEYQDTNYAQRRLMELLYKGSNDLTAVGDDMQSIYGFRGAHIRNLLSFEDHFPGATECRLETNHRSGPEIVALAGHIQNQVDNARPKQLEASGRIPVSSVERFVAADGFDEAQEIARRCVQLHASGQPWSDMAVLCRKRRLIPTISETLLAAGVPVEVIGLGGLLQRPEIVDLIAWLEIIAAAPEANRPPTPDPVDQLTPPDPSVAVLRILRGEPYRLGMRDIAALARAARQHAGGDGHHDMLDLLVAADDVSDIPDLSTDAWTRLHAFNAVRSAIAARRDRLPLGELIELVLERTLSWARADARSTENLIRFTDLAARFIPLPLGPRGSWFGRRSLLEFLEYLQLIAQSEDDVPEAVGSDVDAVNIMTIHQAKGLEFETVFVPGLAGKDRSLSKIFPDGRSGENGVTQAVALPPWMKGDADPKPPRLVKPADLEAPRAAANLERDREEKRLFYVAATRARSRLIFSTAQWYAGVTQPQGPSPFYDLLGSARPPIVEVSRADPPTQDPGVSDMERRNARYRARMQSNEPQPRPLTPKRAGKVRSADQGALFLGDVGVTAPAPVQVPLPNTFATTALATYVRCPRRFFWTSVRPLPRKASQSARIGTAVHKWIEQQANGQLVLTHVDDADDADVVDTEEIGLVEFAGADTVTSGRAHQQVPGDGNGSRESTAKAAYGESRYAGRPPRHVEMPFSLEISGRVVRGRVDAIYTAQAVGDPVGARPGIEIVDFKTGHAPADSVHGHHPTDPSLTEFDPTTMQLDVYGLVAVRVLGYQPGEITVTACYLGGPEGPHYRSRAWSDAEAVAARSRVETALASIAGRRFDPAPGAWCTHCDFEAFCEGSALRPTP